MRVRKKRNGEKRLEACSYMMIEKPSDAFGRTVADEIKRPLCLEIGCGKGRFITEKALQNPGCDFIAMELVSDVIMLAMERAARLENGCPANLRFICGNAANLCEIFEPSSIDTIFLNFSDPWPKARHAKRRLTYRSFLGMYERILRPDGRLIVKTDNDALFDFTLEQLSESLWTVTELSRDLHSSEYSAGNIMTEYETAFSEKGKTINYLCALPQR